MIEGNVICDMCAEEEASGVVIHHVCVVARAHAPAAARMALHETNPRRRRGVLENIRDVNRRRNVIICARDEQRAVSRDRLQPCRMPRGFAPDRSSRAGNIVKDAMIVK